MRLRLRTEKRLQASVWKAFTHISGDPGRDGVWSDVCELGPVCCNHGASGHFLDLGGDRGGCVLTCSLRARGPCKCRGPGGSFGDLGKGLSQESARRRQNVPLFVS